ncbi:MAG: OsmC family protein [Bacteriovoracaceae bacterium]
MSNPNKKFEVHCLADYGINTTFSNTTAKQFTPIIMSIPPEFSGPGNGYSPEDLYAMALMNCYVATFKFIAEKSKLVFSSIRANGVLTVAPDLNQKLWMKHIKIEVTLFGVTQKDRALNLMERTKSNCMILDSVKTEIEFEFIISQ